MLLIAVWLGIVSLFVPPYKKLTQGRTEIDNLQAQVNEQKMLLARQTREVNLAQDRRRPIWKRSRAIVSI